MKQSHMNMSNFKISYNEVRNTRRLVESMINFKNKLSSDPLVIQLERSSEHGPAYTITIYGDGRVVYEGIKKVRIVGIRDAYITRDNLDELLDEFQNVYFFSFNDVYFDSGDKDILGYVTTSITINKESKKVKRYENSARPGGLIELENSIDRFVNSKQWTGAGNRPSD